MNKTEQIRIAAYKGERLPSDSSWTMPERMLWYEYSDLYRRFRAGAIQKEQAEAERNRIMRQYETDSTVQEMSDRVFQAQANLWKRIEAAANAYRRERTLEHADAFIEAVFNVRIKGGAEQ